MQRKLLWIIFGVLLIIILGVYYFLGGFNEVAIEVIEVENYEVVGHYYEGPYERDTIASLFFDAKELLENKILSGDLSVINFENDPEQKHSKIFIGILVNQETSDFPKNLERRKVNGGKVIRASIQSHNIVMPTRDKIDEKMTAFAAANNLTLSGVTIERYVSENQLLIEKYTNP